MIIMIMMVFSSEDYYYFNNNHNTSNGVDDGVWVDETTDYNPSSSSSEINNDDYNEQKTTIDFYKRLCGASLEELTSNTGLDWNQTIELCQNFYNGTWPTITTTFNATINNPDYDDYDDEDGYLNPNLRITLIVLLSLMIVCTVIGNILVCLSVILVRKLRHPSNYLLVSLAISDLCVAILVMPLALHSELSHTWQLSNAICDLWVSFDVTCCTSSILNLCTISIDRYLAITKPLTYGVRRTTRRILSFIVCVWVASCLISIPPVLILGNEHGSESQPRCEVSQHLGYQLYATLGAFYIPLLVMIVMYYKIYMAAKRVVDAELRDQRPSSTSMAFRAQRSITNRFYSIKKNSRDEQIQPSQQRNKQYPPIRLDKNRNYWDKSKASPDELEELNKNGNRKRNKKRSKSQRSSSKRKSIGEICHYCCCCCCGQKYGCGRVDGGQDDQQSKNAQQTNDDVDDQQQNLQPKTSTASMMVNSTTDGLTTTCSVVTTTTCVAVTPPATGHKHLNGHQKLLTAQTSNTSNISSSTGSNNNDNGNDHHHRLHHQQTQQQHHFGFMKKYHRSISGVTTTSTRISGGGSASVNDNASSTSTLAKQRASNALRERKASVTLGIIMSAFTVCWLPFFILALLRPFSASVMDIPRYVNSIALWLGYANSMLNPIIYVTFHQDFRRAFKYLLCLQCRSMGSKLRAEAYLSQYGNKKFNTANNNNIDNHSKQPQLHSLTTPTTPAKMVKPNHPDSEIQQQQQLLRNPDGTGPIASSSVIIHDGTITYAHDDSMMSQEDQPTEAEQNKTAADFSNKLNNTEASPGETIMNLATSQPYMNMEGVPSSTSVTNTTTTTNAIMNNNSNGGGCGLKLQRGTDNQPTTKSE